MIRKMTRCKRQDIKQVTSLQTTQTLITNVTVTGKSNLTPKETRRETKRLKN